jgi:hypothetical protein
MYKHKDRARWNCMKSRDFKIFFAKKMGEKIGVFDSKES